MINRQTNMLVIGVFIASFCLEMTGKRLKDLKNIPSVCDPILQSKKDCKNIGSHRVMTEWKLAKDRHGKALPADEVELSLRMKWLEFCIYYLEAEQNKDRNAHLSTDGALKADQSA